MYNFLNTLKNICYQKVLKMNPILKVISFLFKKENIDIKNNTIKSFFDSGTLFPKFVALSLKIDEIPNIIPKPKQKEEKEANNEIALAFLSKKNEAIAKTNLRLETVEDQYNILKQILTKQCFSINEQEILNKCNAIAEKSNIHFSNKSELINWKSLLILLNTLSGENFQTEDETQNNFEHTNNFFQKAQIPLVIDQTSLKDENQFLFYIQIEILFDFYSEKVHPFKSQSKLTFTNSPSQSQDIGSDDSDSSMSTDSSKSDTDTNTDFDEVDNEMDDEKRLKNLLPNNYREAETDSEEEEEEEEKVEKSEEQERSVVHSILDDIKIDQIEVDDFESGSSSSSSEDMYEDRSSSEEAGTKEGESLHSIKKKKIITKFISFQALCEQALLKTINSLSKEINLHFENFHQTIEDDAIPKFVMHVLHIDSIENVYVSQKKIFHGLKELNEIEQRNISAVIEYLKKKESKFDVLSFNFRNKYLAESSAILFYKTFLNFFFVKKSKEEMFQRLARILFPTKRISQLKERKILTRWNTYIDLAYFVIDNNNKMKKNESLFQKGGIPLIFEKSFLDCCLTQKELPFTLYYQLQFIFDALDSRYIKSQVAEYLLIALAKLNQIQVPRIDIITSSIRAKNISLILQSRKHKKYVLEKSMKEEINKEAQKEQIIKKEEEDDEKIPLKYIDRLEIKSSENLNKKEIDDNQNIESSNQFWNKPIIGCTFKNGILRYDDNNDQNNESKWKSEIQQILQNATKKKDKNKSALLFDDPSLQTNLPSKLYKLFIFDEKTKKWKLNSVDLNDFQQHIKCSTTSIKTPLVLFLNSLEKDLISINSKLIDTLYPPLDDDNKDDIYVYALSERNLCSLNYAVDMKNKKKSNIRPIFLLLHIPKGKENHPDIQRIVVSIYSFLSFISDFEIVLLNGKDYRNQFEMIELISSIQKSYSKREQRKSSSTNISPIKSPPIPPTKSFLHPFSSKNKKQEEIVVEITDSEDDDSLSESDENYYDDSEYENQLISPKSSSQIIFLVNEPTYQANKVAEEKLNESLFFKRNLRNINEKKRTIHLINANDSSTYKSFLDNLNDLAQNCQSTFNDVEQKMQFIEMSEMSNIYLSLKRKDDWKDELEKLINKRFIMLNKDDSNSFNSMLILSVIKKEISSISSPFDNEFKEHCTSLIAKMKKKINLKNREIFASELKISSEMNLKPLYKIDFYEFRSPEKADSFIIEHVSFLKEEYFTMIKSLSDSKFFNIDYEENIDILNQQIENDIQAINDHAQREKEKYEKALIDNVEEEIQKGANYCIREAENVREIKVQINVGEKLEDVIKQDF